MNVTALTIIAAVLSAPLAHAGAGSLIATEPPLDCAEYGAVLTVSEAPEGTDVIACQLVGVTIVDRSSDAGIVIPAPGEGVTMHREMASGQDEEFSVEVAPDGEITYPEYEQAAGGPGGSTLGPCEDDFYSVGNRKRFSDYKFEINVERLPNDYDQSNVVGAIKRGASHWPQVDDDCGINDTISMGQEYLGLTNNDEQIDSNGGTTVDCTGNDGNSVVGFGPLGGGVTAVTCSYTEPATDPTGQYPFISRRITQADIRFNNDESWTTDIKPNCTNTRDWESSATHEMGHVWGLNDIWGNHTKMTMYGQGFTCTVFKQTLGRGDVRGLKRLYD